MRRSSSTSSRRFGDHRCTFDGIGLRLASRAEHRVAIAVAGVLAGPAALAIAATGLPAEVDGPTSTGIAIMFGLGIAGISVAPVLPVEEWRTRLRSTWFRRPPPAAGPYPAPGGPSPYL